MLVGMARLLPILGLLLTACGSPAVRADLPYAIDDLGVGEEVGFRGAARAPDGTLWTCGAEGTVLVSRDGGASWQRVAVPGAGAADFRDVHAGPAGQVILLAAGEGGASSLWHSPDAGGIWRRVLTNPDARGFFDAIAFDPDGAGLLLGDPLGGAFTVFRSDDGLSWQRVERARNPQAADGEYAFAASGSCLVADAPGEFWLATGGSRTRVWHTESGGAVWFDTGAPPVPSGESAGHFGVGIGPGGRVMVVGGDYAEPDQPSDLLIGSLADGWQHRADALPGYRSAVLAVPERPGHWIAVGSHGADWSHDDGSSWQPLPLRGHTAVGAGPGRVLVVGGPDEPHRFVRFDRPSAD